MSPRTGVRSMFKFEPPQSGTSAFSLVFFGDHTHATTVVLSAPHLCHSAPAMSRWGPVPLAPLLQSSHSPQHAHHSLRSQVLDPRRRTHSTTNMNSTFDADARAHDPWNQARGTAQAPGGHGVKAVDISEIIRRAWDGLSEESKREFRTRGEETRQKEASRLAEANLNSTREVCVPPYTAAAFISSRSCPAPGARIRRPRRGSPPRRCIAPPGGGTDRVRAFVASRHWSPSHRARLVARRSPSRRFCKRRV